MQQRIYTERIGEIKNGIDGNETYLSVKCDSDFTEEDMTNSLRSVFCYSSSHPGAMFCDMVHVTHKKYTKNEAIAIIYERYDN
jgi:hypothetical protein